MKIRTPGVGGLLLVVGAVSCTTTTGPGKGSVTVTPAALGAFNCVAAGPVASPPPKGMVALGYVRDEKRTIVRRKAKPLLTIRLCGAGQVPVSKAPALPTVAKGNPLIGKIDRPFSDFFKDRETGALIRRSLRPFEKVYFIKPGPDTGKHQSPPDPPPCNGTSCASPVSPR